jgi:rhodanese-related sulfurtransferase
MDGEIASGRLEDALADEDGPLVVDIRGPEAYRRGHIPDSVNLPLSELVGDVDRVTDVEHVVTVCPHGEASVKAARLIAAYEGFDGRVESLEGGLTAWDGPLAGENDDGPVGEEPEAPF